VLPQEYSLFLEEFKKSDGATWIMKPIGKSQGKGIFLFNQLSQISDWKKDHTWKADGPHAEAYVVQRYILRPFLVGGKKFDMRLYCLVTSYSPLTVWVHRAGFARFSNTRYSDDPDDLTNSYMHLTNYSIQKTDVNYDADQGIKWHVRDLRLHIASKFDEHVVDKLFADTQDLIVRSLLAVQQAIIADKHSFELYGFDVLFDQDFHPWLLEVNASPSITKSGDEDHQLKFDVLNDMLDVVDIEGNLRGDETSVRGFDMVYQGGFITHACKLGCFYETSPMPQRL
jgi:tubulin polyglutamylase TTLL9